MVKIDKRYTIKYSKAGVAQYADFRYVGDKLFSHTFCPNWVKNDDVPSLEGLNDINDILEVIKEFSYANNATIHLIDGNIVSYDNIKDTIVGELVDVGNEFDDLVSTRSFELFQKHILPILNKNKWVISRSHMYMPILCCYDENGELGNIRDCEDSDLIYYISYEIMGCFSMASGIDVESEFGNNISSENFAKMINKIDVDKLKELGIYIENE